ncbi:helix-turn-helix domain-containing protein [Neobacillus sp. SAB-20_R2A]|uniref:helix-turn-helix domain-containing protein n=1 Tax=Neobacillus sp. SAB-20_R2A TaxID=3120519 RepID=UPI003C6E50F9
MEGNRIRKLRMKKGISLNKLSKETGVSKSYLSFLERDIKSNPSLDILKKIAESLKVDIEYLIATSSMNEEKSQNERGLLKLQIELSEEEIDNEKYDRIKELIDYFKDK